MAWYDEAVFYHIYPLGMTGAPQQNFYGEAEHRLNSLIPWISHIKKIGCNAIYIGPLFESVGHGYETTDYKKLDSRLGTNEDLTNFVSECHKAGIRVILDGVFNHTGRDFFAFQDVKRNRENSAYKDWFCNVNFWGNNEYNDGFSYENWGGYNLLVKLNQKNPAVQEYICDVIRFWVKEYDIDGIRLDAADVLDFDYMQALRRVANEVKPEFWLMGEVIHGDYTRWVNGETLHSVTNYHLHKALYSGHNDHNYFEIAHTVRRQQEMGGNGFGTAPSGGAARGLKLYNFVDNHDVERIYTKLNNKAHFVPVHVLLYTLPGIPSIYYGSEFGIEGRKEWGSDASLRPCLSYEQYQNAVEENENTKLIAALGKVRQKAQALAYGDYRELLLTTGQYAFSRSYNGETVLVTVNNGDNDYTTTLASGNASAYIGVLTGEKVSVNNGQITVNVKGNSGEVWIPAEEEECVGKETETVSQREIPVVKTEMDVQEDAPGEEVKQPEQAEVPRTETQQPEQAEVPETETQQPQQEEGSACEEEENGSEPGAADEAQEEPEQPMEASAEPETSQAAEMCTESEKEQHKHPAPNPAPVVNKPYEEMTVEELQNVILEKMRKNGPVTDRMYRDVMENVYHNSLVTWAKSFR